MITKVLTKEDPDFAKTPKECEEEVTLMFVDAVDFEKHGQTIRLKMDSTIGPNAKLLHDYIEWIAPSV